MKHRISFLITLLLSWNLYAGGPSGIGGGGSGGGGASTAAQVSFTQSGTGAVATNLDAINKARAINALTDFGCDNSGATDTATALQAAMTSAIAQNRALYLPAGTYKIGTALTMANGTGSGTYGDGFTIFGDGPKLSIIQTSGGSTNGLVIPHDCENIRIESLGVTGTGTSSTATGLLLDGSLNNSGGGGGDSIDGLLCQNVLVQKFKTGLHLSAVSGSTFTAVAVDQAHTSAITGTGFLIDSSCNSDKFICCDGTGGDVEINLNGGRAVSVIGGEWNVTGNGVEFIVNQACTVMEGMNVEHSGTSSAISLLAGDLTLINNYISGGTTAPYAVENNGGALYVLAGNGFPAFTKTPVRIDSTISYPAYSTQANVTADWYTSSASSTVVARTLLLPYRSIVASDGSSPSAATIGQWIYRNEYGLTGTGAGVDDLYFDVQTGNGTYGRANFGTLIGAMIAGTVPYLNAAQTWTNNQTMANDGQWVANDCGGSPGGSITGGFVYSGFRNGTKNWGWYKAEFTDDLGLYYSTGTSSSATDYASGATTNPARPVFYVDAANNRTSIGHAAATKPAGTATLNVEGGSFAKSIGGSAFGGTATSIATGAGAGTLTQTATLDVNANDISGTITVNTGTAPSVGSVIATVTFGAAKSTAPHVVMWPANAATSVLALLPYTTGTTTTFTISSGAALALVGATTYSWNYVVVQ